MQQLIGNLGIKRTVAQNSHATVLLMPSQAFINARSRHIHKLQTTSLFAKFKVPYRILHLTPDGQEWSLEAALDALSLSTFSRLYISDGARVGRVTCSSATARSVSRWRHLCIAYWPVWCVIPPSVCLQHVWELPSKACAVADGPVLGGTHETQLLETRLGLLASICQSITRIQVMTRL